MQGISNIYYYDLRFVNNTDNIHFNMYRPVVITTLTKLI